MAKFRVLYIDGLEEVFEATGPEAAKVAAINPGQWLSFTDDNGQEVQVNPDHIRKIIEPNP